MRVIVWLKGLTRQDEIIEDVERISWIRGTDHVLLKLWDRTELTYTEIESVLVID